MLVKELVEIIAKEKGVSVDIVEKAITAQTERILQAVENRESVRLSNLGFFVYKESKRKKPI